MILNMLGLLLILLLAVGFGWLALRAVRAKNIAVKGIGLVVSGLLSLLMIVAAVLTIIGLVRLNSTRVAPLPDIPAEFSQEQIDRGEHIANIFCASCHSPTNELPLVGGRDLGADFPIPVGSFFSANLTPGGPLKDWTDEEIFRAIRNGAGKGDKWLFVMSSYRGRNLSDEDIISLVAYLRSQPAVENDVPTVHDQPNLLGVIMFGAGMIPAGAPVIENPVSSPPKEASQAYGEYILSFQDCRDCHGEDLTGGVEGQLSPLGPNLKVVQGWTQDEFINTLRTGVDPAGNELDNVIMPWKNIGRMDDIELSAVYMALQALP
jgi:mono/diheme cytochrome c family protein